MIGVANAVLLCVYHSTHTASGIGSSTAAAQPSAAAASRCAEVTAAANLSADHSGLIAAQSAKAISSACTMLNRKTYCLSSTRRTSTSSAGTEQSRSSTMDVAGPGGRGAAGPWVISNGSRSVSLIVARAVTRATPQKNAARVNHGRKGDQS